MELEIIPQEINAVTIFSNPVGITAILEDIKKKAMSIIPDTTTAKGRKEIASVAYKVAQSKTLLDTKGKELVAEWKEKSKKVDEQRKIAREFLDNLRDEVRQPLTEWEKAEDARIAAEIAAAKLFEDWNQAEAENALFDRMKEIERKEAEIAKAEQERLKKEAEAEAIRLAKEAEIAAAAEKARVEKEQDEREALAAKKAKEDAEKEAAERAEAERAKAARQLEEERERAEAKLRAEIQAAAQREADAKAEAKRLAMEAEARRLADIKAAEEKAEAEKQEIIKEQARKDKAEADRAEAERKRIAAEKEIEAKRQADVNHRKIVNNAAKDGLLKLGVSDDMAIAIIKAIVAGQIKNVTIQY